MVKVFMSLEAILERKRRIVIVRASSLVFQSALDVDFAILAGLRNSIHGQQCKDAAIVQLQRQQDT